MRRRILRWLAPLLLAGTCWLPASLAQQGQPTPQPQPGQTPPSAAEPPPPAPVENKERAPKTDVLPGFVALLCTILVLVIVCMPSRKA